MSKAIHFFAMVSMCIVTVQGEKDLHLVHADRNVNAVSDGTMVSKLFGDVTFDYGDVRIVSDTVILYREQGEFSMSGAVRVSSPGYRLTCDQAHYGRRGEVLRLTENVELFDSTDNMLIYSDTADYFLRQDSVFLFSRTGITLQDQPAPSASKDTLITLTADFMSYFRGTGQAYGNLQVRGDDLSGTADTAMMWPGGDSLLFYNTARFDHGPGHVSGDSLRVYFTKKQLDRFCVTGGAPRAEFAEEESEYSLSIAAEELLFRIDSRQISRIRARNDAELIRSTDTAENAALHILSRFITADFADGSPTRLRVFGMKEARQYEQESGRHTTAFADTMIVHVDTGRVSQLRLWPSAQMQIFEDPEKKDVVWGDTLVYNYLSDTLRSFSSFVDVRTIYHTDSDRVNELTGDSLYLQFHRGRVDSLHMGGSAFGELQRTQ
ncbi:MAG: hypothetical protein ACQEQ4_07045 [Fibrobacterota bacterium]